MFPNIGIRLSAEMEALGEETEKALRELAEGIFQRLNTDMEMALESPPSNSLPEPRSKLHNEKVENFMRQVDALKKRLGALGTFEGEN